MKDSRPIRHWGLANMLFWAVIAAAFIGPGTVTTAARAGAQYGTALIWTLIFSILATMVMQEAAARLTISTGLNLGQHVRRMFDRLPVLPVLVWLGIAFGCAAYEAGNILGAVSGIAVALPDIDSRIFVIVITGIAWWLLRSGSTALIARVLGLIVAVMGIAFIITAIHAPVGWRQVLSGSVIPRLPEGSILLVIALIGTTIVPYNLFLGSGISHGQTVRQMRSGLIPAILVGGVISVAILLSGTVLRDAMTFDALADAMAGALGPWSRYLFAIGLLAAGLTSAITAPLAAAITARSIFPGWTEHSVQYRAVWMAVLLAGFIMGILGLRPIPVILAAQAVNGILLAFIAMLLFAVCTSHTTRTQRQSTAYTGIFWIILLIVVFLGANSLISAAERAGIVRMAENVRMSLGILGACVLCVPLLVLGLRRR